MIKGDRTETENIKGVHKATRLDNIDPDDNMFLAAAYSQEGALRYR